MPEEQLNFFWIAPVIPMQHCLHVFPRWRTTSWGTTIFVSGGTCVSILTLAKEWLPLLVISLTGRLVTHWQLVKEGVFILELSLLSILKWHRPFRVFERPETFQGPSNTLRPLESFERLADWALLCSRLAIALRLSGTWPSQVNI